MPVRCARRCRGVCPIRSKSFRTTLAQSVEQRVFLAGSRFDSGTSLDGSMVEHRCLIPTTRVRFPLQRNRRVNVITGAFEPFHRKRPARRCVRLCESTAQRNVRSGTVARARARVPRSGTRSNRRRTGRCAAVIRRRLARTLLRDRDARGVSTSFARGGPMRSRRTAVPHTGCADARPPRPREPVRRGASNTDRTTRAK